MNGSSQLSNERLRTSLSSHIATSASRGERAGGQRVRFSGALKCERVENRVGLWMRVDGPQRQMVAFDNMAGRPVSGTTDWKRYEVVLDVPDEAQAIALGVLLVGKGKAWMSDFNVEVVGPEVETTDAGMSAALPERPQNLDFSEPLTAAGE